jgi:hypothetical protein
MPEAPITFVTDTATMCVFDPAALRHRLNDEDDWWADPDQELAEVRAGNALFVELGEDGSYSAHVVQHRVESGAAAVVRFPSGRIFIGAAEEVTSGGMEPTGVRGGTFLSVAPGSYSVQVARVDGGHGLVVAICACVTTGPNIVNDVQRV